MPWIAGAKNGYLRAPECSGNVHQARIITDDGRGITDRRHRIFKTGLTAPIDDSVWMSADCCDITAN